jgi:hypothetical protein
LEYCHSPEFLSKAPFTIDRLFRLSHKEIAIKRVLARQLAEELTQKKIAKTDLVERIQTIRAQLDRLFTRNGIYN